MTIWRIQNIYYTYKWIVYDAHRLYESAWTYLAAMDIEPDVFDLVDDMIRTPRRFGEPKTSGEVITSWLF